MTSILTYQPCDRCGSPLDEDQRYCVTCGASRHHPDDPVARYLATRRRGARAATTAAPVTVAERPTGRLLAVAVALLPIACGVGVLVGRGHATDTQDVLAALRAQKAPLVRITGGGASAGVGAGTVAAGGRSAHVKTPKAAKPKVFAAKVAAAAKKSGIAADKIDPTRTPTPQQKSQGAAIVKQIQADQGKSYVDRQRTLPDTIAIP